MDQFPKPLRVSTFDLDDLHPSPQPSPIALAFEKSLCHFRDFYIALTNENCTVTDQLSISRIGDEYGRLGVWGRNSGADRKGRGSIDDVVRNDLELSSIILDILDDLCGDLEVVTEIARHSAESMSIQERKNTFDSDSDSMSSSASDSGTSSTEGSIAPSKRGEMSRVSSRIFEHIRSLYKVSALLRRPQIQDKYIRSTAKDSDRHKALHFAEWDQAHVAEKMWQWALDMDMKFESRIDGTNYICVRAAAANMRRREQLSYWQRHPDVTDVPKKTAEVFANRAEQPLETLPIRRPPSDCLPEGNLPQIDTAPEPTQKTVQSFSTVAKSVLNENETFSGHPKTIYAPSTVGRSRGICVPNPPSQPEGAVGIECPYCLTTLNSKAVQQRQLWKKHVFRDLRPYICTFKDCINPEQLYVTRHDWMYHEIQMHRRRWVCSGHCDLSFCTRDAVELHLREKHPETFTELQLPFVIDICERPADQNENSCCPLCPAEMPLSKLQLHLATHLEELALFVLPVYMSDKSQRSGSNHGEGGNDNSSRMEDLPSLGSFSDAGSVHLPDRNSPDQLAKLIEDEDKVEISTSVVQDWLEVSDETKPVSSPPASPVLPSTSSGKPELAVYTQMYETDFDNYINNRLTHQSSKTIGLLNAETKLVEP